MLAASIIALAEAGAGLDAALASATTVAAEVCGLAGTKGRLRAGYDADLLLVDGDPSCDLTALARPAVVVLAGQLVSGYAGGSRARLTARRRAPHVRLGWTFHPESGLLVSARPGRWVTEEADTVTDSGAGVILAALRPVMDGLAATFGPTCEVVLHDYRQGEQSVVAVSGSVTGRTVGGALSEIGLSVLAQGDAAANDLNYMTRTPDGRLIKSSTMPLRDGTGHVFGALCVNIDVTALRQAGDLLTALAGSPAAQVPATTFSDDFDDVVDALVRAEELARGTPVAGLARSERLDLLRVLDRRGIFAVRNAVPRVAERLGLSRSAVYADLADCRRTADETTSSEGSR